MRIAMGFLLVCATACAANRQPLPAPSSLQVDPLSEVVAIPPGLCPGLDDHFAMSTNAVRMLLMHMAAKETDRAVELARCNGAVRIADKRREQAEAEADSNAAWRRWGPLGIVIGLTAGAVAGGVVGVALGRK